MLTSLAIKEMQIETTSPQSKWRSSITETTTNAEEDVGKRNASSMLVGM
jgi:hypothetical protein